MKPLVTIPEAVELEARAVAAGVGEFFFDFWRRGRLTNEAFLYVVEAFEKATKEESK